MKELQALFKRVIEKHGIDQVEAMVKFVGEIAMQYGEWVGSEGAMDYYLMKGHKEKIEIFEKWLSDYMNKQKDKIDKEKVTTTH